MQPRRATDAVRDLVVRNIAGSKSALHGQYQPIDLIQDESLRVAKHTGSVRNELSAVGTTATLDYTRGKFLCTSRYNYNNYIELMRSVAYAYICRYHMLQNTPYTLPYTHHAPTHVEVVVVLRLE
jgi:hypothetical protein